jgi:cell division septation protein DedD
VAEAAPVRAAAPAPRLQLPRATPASADDKKPQGEDETIVISSANQPVFDAREFMPASVEAGKLPVIQRSLGDIPMTAAEKNVVQRFETLRRLAEDSLITQEEFIRRRQANVGALLPYTKDPAAEGLERSVPSSDAIVARLAALRRSFEMRAITAPQHAMERTMILNALLPETPQDRMERKPPPVDVIQGAAMVGHLEQIRQKNLITTDEFEAEKAAIEHVLRTGLLPSQEMQGADEKKAAAAKAASAKGKPGAASTASAAAAVPADITGPVVHLGSFRNEDSAKQGWQEIVSQNKTTLGSLKQVIRRVELGQGTFYRVMAGPFNSVSDAEAVCIQLKQANQFCRASADGN